MSLSIRTALFLVLGTLVARSAPAEGAHGHAGPSFDCNGNGIEDAVDIAFGTSSDVNQNGVPDECERA